MYSREFPTGGNFLFFVVCMMSLFRLPCGKLAFAQRSGAMKAPVGLLSDRTVLRKQDGGALPRQVTAGLPRCSSRQGWPGRMPVPDGRWLHRDRGKCLWTFSFCSNARSFDRPTVAKPGEKIEVPIFIRRKGADVFCLALAAGGSLMAYKCLSLCRFRGFTAGFCKNFIQRFQKFKMRLQGKAKNFDLFRMRKKFRVQVERNFPTLSHERFSIVEPVVQFEKLLGNIIAFINAGCSCHTCGLPSDRQLQTRNRHTQGC